MIIPFWVVCRDLARQIFASQKLPLKCIRLSNDITGVAKSAISRLTIQKFVIKHLNCHLIPKYGRVFVYFITPEQNRYLILIQLFHLLKYVLLIDLTNIEYKKKM